MQSKIEGTWTTNDTGYGWDGQVSRYEITRPISDDERQAALSLAEEALAPATEDFVLSELGRLRVLTVSREVGQDLALVLAAYADELRRYPADAVREVLRSRPAGKFWPAWDEMEGPLERLVAPRRALHDALKRGYREPEQIPAPVPPPTPEQKQAVADLLAN